MKNHILFLVLLTLSNSGFAVETTVAQGIEASCRIKAKEIAAETYRGCVTESKNAMIEKIKEEYKNKLQALKAHYEQELKKMSPQKASAAPAVSPAAASADTPADESVMDLPEPVPVENLKK